MYKKKLIFLYNEILMLEFVVLGFVNYIIMELSEKKLWIKLFELFVVILMLFKKIINNIFKIYSVYEFV